MSTNNLNAIGSEQITGDEGLDGILAFLKTMVDNGSAEEQWYHKACVSVAHTYLENKELEKILETVARVSPDYYKSRILEHMDDDPEYSEQVYVLAKYLSDNRIVHIGFSEEEKTRVIEV